MNYSPDHETRSIRVPCANRCEKQCQDLGHVPCSRNIIWVGTVSGLRACWWVGLSPCIHPYPYILLARDRHIKNYWETSVKNYSHTHTHLMPLDCRILHLITFLLSAFLLFLLCSLLFFHSSYSSILPTTLLLTIDIRVTNSWFSHCHNGTIGTRGCQVLTNTLTTQCGTNLVP